MHRARQLKADVARVARRAGFTHVGVARATRLDADAARLRAWLQSGHHGVLGYMADTAPQRADPRHPGILPEARSVIMLARPYARGGEHGFPLPTGGVARVAKYAWGRDYHRVMGKGAAKVAKALREQGFKARSGVDSKPIMERAWAARAGLGFIGKNSCLIIPGVGSHVLLAAVVTSAALPPDTPMRQRCGRCTRCLDACPTEAFVAAHELDARRCISTLTIESRGSMPPSLRRGVGSWLFGCDVCQDVCPYNQTKRPTPGDITPFLPPAGRFDVPLTALLRCDDAQFDAWTEGSPLRRARRSGLARNAAVVLGNVGGAEALDALKDAAANHDDAVVREHAAWALREAAG